MNYYRTPDVWEAIAVATYINDQRAEPFTDNVTLMDVGVFEILDEFYVHVPFAVPELSIAVLTYDELWADVPLPPELVG